MANDLDSMHDVVMRHEHSLDTLASGMSNLVKVSDVTNSKLEKLTDAIAHQNVIAEKIHNMDANIREGFKQRDTKLEEIIDVQNNSGCHKAILAAEEVKGLCMRMDTMTTRVETVETAVADTVSATTIRWSLGLLFVLMMSLGATLIDNNTSIAAQYEINEHQKHQNIVIERKFEASDKLHSDILGSVWEDRDKVK